MNNKIMSYREDRAPHRDLTEDTPITWDFAKAAVPASIRANAPLWKELSYGFEREDFIIMNQSIAGLRGLFSRYQVHGQPAYEFVDFLNSVKAQEAAERDPARNTAKLRRYGKVLFNIIKVLSSFAAMSFAIGCGVTPAPDGSVSVTEASNDNIFTFGDSSFDFIDQSTIKIYYAAGKISGVSFGMGRVMEENSNAMPSNLTISIIDQLYGASITLIDDIAKDDPNPSRAHTITRAIPDGFTGDITITPPTAAELENFEHDANIIFYSLDTVNNQVTFTTVNDTNATAYFGIPFFRDRSVGLDDTVSVDVSGLTVAQLDQLRLSIRDAANNTMDFTPSSSNPLINGTNVIKIRDFTDLVKMLNGASALKVDSTTGAITVSTTSGSGIQVMSTAPYTIDTNTQIKFRITVSDTSSGYLRDLLQNLTFEMQDDAGTPLKRQVKPSRSLYDLAVGTVTDSTTSVDIVIPVNGADVIGDLIADWGNTNLIGIHTKSSSAANKDFKVSGYTVSQDGGSTWDADHTMFRFDMNNVSVLGVVYYKGTQVINGVLANPKLRTANGDELLYLKKSFTTTQKVSVSANHSTAQQGKVQWNHKVSWR